MQKTHRFSQRHAVLNDSQITAVMQT